MNVTEPCIESIETSVHRFPTSGPEADGTLRWDATTAVVVSVASGDHIGLGWTYSTAAAATVVQDHLWEAIRGLSAFDIDAAWSAMHRACRNLGTKGLVMQALSAVDIALWDLKSRLLDTPLAQLLGAVRRAVAIYGSGGFTNLNSDQLAAQVDEWRVAGCTAMKIKIGEGWGQHVSHDLQRVRQLRELAGENVDLMVDANGGYTVGQARRVGSELDELGVV